MKDNMKDDTGGMTEEAGIVYSLETNRLRRLKMLQLKT